VREMGDRSRMPRLYAIVDAGLLPAEQLAGFVRELAAAGVTLMQYRDKRGGAAEMLRAAREVRQAAGAARLILNDRADLCLAAGADGVHVGQEDLSPEGARGIVGDGLWVGVSTHSPEQVREAEGAPVDYVAVGPVFATTSKERPDPVIGLEGVRRARALTAKPLVAIGGITRSNCRSVIEAGADSVAVISDLLIEPRQAAAEFIEHLSSGI
jgi:thiamine-phosphate pyrophosphorylase